MKPHPTLLLLFALAGLSGSPGALAEAGASAAELETAVRLYRSEGAEKALPEFERLHARFADAGDQENSIRAERYVGESYWRLGSYDRSRQHLEHALAASRRLGQQRLDEGKILNVLGLLEWALGRYDQAIEDFRQASSIGTALGDRRLAGSTMNNLSLVHDELGEYTTSLEQYQQALELYEGADFPRGESDTLGNIGGTHLLLGRYQEALSYYQRALAISEALGSKASLGLDHGNMALCYLGLGRIDRAIEHFDRAIGLAVETGMRKEQALWLRGKGNAQIRQGRYDLGLASHRSALEIYEQIDARGVLLDAVHDMGRIHLLLGDTQTAKQYFQRGAVMARELGAAQAVTANLLALGDLQSTQEHPTEASAFYEQALQRATDAGELHLQAESLLRLAAGHRGLGLLEQAGAEARRALAIAERIGAGDAVAGAWYEIAELERIQGHHGDALAAYDRAQAGLEPGLDPDLLWQVHYGRARLLIANREEQEAVAELEAAVRIIESVRQRLREERFRAGYIQDKYEVYVTLVQLQMKLGLIQQAFATAERLRARSFLDQLDRGGAVVRNEQDDLAEYALRERIRQLQTALDEENGMPAPERRQAAVDVFSSELLAAEREYQAFLDDVQGRSLSGSNSRVPSLQEVQARLEPGAALVEYVLADDGVMIFVVRPEGISAARGAADVINLNAKVRLLRELIQQPSGDGWRGPAASLADSLIVPLQQESLLEGVDHLYLVPQGILNYLPFAVLPLGEAGAGQVLVERFTLAYLPTAATLVGNGAGRRVRSSLLAMAPGSARLRHSQEEARSVASLFQPGSRALTGQNATESAFKQQAGDYGILHLSTHGYFNSNNPMFSGLELETDEHDDGMLQVHEILGLSLDAGLVTLSACETALGSGYFNRIPAGDDFVSLTRAFLIAGSRSVLATLWEVDDRSTVDLMEGFYSRLNRGGTLGNTAAALAQVQRQLKNSGTHEHPFYWAPFVLVGQQETGGEVLTLSKRG